MDETYKAALDLWGAEAQTLMAMEEMAELQKELCKHARGKDNREEISEEIADVRIMLDQMAILHNCEELAGRYKASKVERLRKAVNEEMRKIKGGRNAGELEKAIQEFEDNAYHRDMHPEISEEAKAIALASMKEKLERATGPECEWCETFRKNNGWSVYVGDGRYEHIKYKFCPVCGQTVD